jgi:hypothetical protein
MRSEQNYTISDITLLCSITDTMQVINITSKKHKKFCLENLRARHHLGDQGIDGRIILWHLKKEYDVVK